ncbi:MAG: alpha/beta fold hydrolase [Litorilinea sp.]
MDEAMGSGVRALMWLGIGLGGGVLALYILYALYFYTIQRTMLFPRHVLPPPPPTFDVPGALDLGVDMPAGTVEAWLLLPDAVGLGGTPVTPDATPPYPLVVIGHGNGEIIDYWAEAIVPLRARGVAVLLVEYPGYGRSAGVPSQASIVDVFVRAYDAAVVHPKIDAARVVLFGRSVGGGVVAQLATRRPSAGMVLLSTFASVGAMAAHYRLPGALARDPFDTQAVVKTYTAPLLLLHGEHDSVIPFGHAQRLHAAAPHAELRALPCGHNDCIDDWPAFWDVAIMPLLDGSR